MLVSTALLLADQPVYLLQTPDGSEGQSTLPQEDLPTAFPGACVVGDAAAAAITRSCLGAVLQLNGVSACWSSTDTAVLSPVSAPATGCQLTQCVVHAVH